MLSRIAALYRIPFVKDVATLQMGRTVAIACGFVTSIVYVRFLGLGGYGQYATILAFVGTLGIITNLGQQATLMTFLSESFGREDKEGMRDISQYYVYMSALVFVILTALALWAPTITQKIYDNPTIGSLARLVFVSSLFEFAFSYYSIALQVVREIRTLTILENTKVVLQVVLAVVFLILGYGVVGVLLSSVVASVTFMLVTLVRYPRFRKRHGLPSFGEMIRGSTLHHVWRYGKDGVLIAVDKNAGNLYPNIFIFAVSTQAPESVVGLVRLAYKLADLPTSFALTNIARLSNSVLSTIAGKSSDLLRTTVIRLMKHAVVLHTGITFVGAVVVSILLPYVYGVDFAIARYPFLVLTFLNITQSIQTPATPVLRVHSKIYIATILNVSAMIVSLVAFSLLHEAITPVRALYVAMVIYQGMQTMIVFPLWRLLQTPRT